MEEKRIEIKCTGTKSIRLETFKELQGNLKELSKVNYEKLKASILKYGFSFPVFCYKDKKDIHWVMDAHQRINTLKLLQSDGYYIPDLPTIFVEAKDKREAKEKLLQLNSNYGKIQDEGLYEFMNEPNFEIDVNFLKEIDLPDIDLEKFELGYFKEQDSEILNDVPALQEKAISKLGDLFLIDGKHRVLCGDSTKEENVKLLMDGRKADICLQSPPYNIGKTPNGNKQKYQNNTDNESKENYLALLSGTTANAIKYSLFSFINIQSVSGNKNILIDYLHKFKDSFCDYIIWDKLQAEPAMGNNILNSRFEFVYIFGGNSKRSIGVNKFRGNLDNIIFIKSRQDKEFSDIHKATYPVEFAMYFINNFSLQSCLDLFLGTGTTLIACEQTNRILYGIELDEHYIDVILRRYKKLYPECKIECLNRKYNFKELLNEKG